MGKKLGTICMGLGLLLILAALVLFLRNQQEARQAGQTAELVLPRLMAVIPSEPESPAAPVPSSPAAGASAAPELSETPLLPENALEVPTEPDPTMTEAEIDGRRYIGCLTIPALDLELPVLSQLDDSSLKLSPCRYAGSTKTDDLVIGGHNYVQHFAYLSRLSPGDAVYFLDMDGVLSTYQVAAVEVLEETAVAEMTAGDYALTLFTCTYGGGSRVTVRCDRTDS